MPVPATTTRPTLARVKESIFNLISYKVADAVVLDLFAGSGAFGAECISRGSKKVYFTDMATSAIETIKKNTKNMVEDFEIIKSDYTSALAKFGAEGKKFDIIYLDPPYKSDYAVRSLELIQKLNLLADDGLIIVEHESENDLQNAPSCYIIKTQRKYGIAYVDILVQNKG